MKTFSFSLIRSLIAITLGVLLIMWPELALTNLIKAVGILFLLPAIISLCSYAYGRYKGAIHKTSFPIEAIGGGAFGLWLICSPSFFINSIMYVLGLLLLIGSIYQLSILFLLKRLQAISAWLYLFPALILATGFFIFFNPGAVLANIASVFGVICLLYGFLELAYSFLVYRKYEKAIIIKSEIKSSSSEATDNTVVVEEVEAEEIK